MRLRERRCCVLTCAVLGLIHRDRGVWRARLRAEELDDPLAIRAVGGPARAREERAAVARHEVVVVPRPAPARRDGDTGVAREIVRSRREDARALGERAKIVRRSEHRAGDRAREERVQPLRRAAEGGGPRERDDAQPVHGSAHTLAAHLRGGGRMPGPLDDVRVLEVASFISGPYAAMLLADLGAEVIKVEPPGTGDPFRGWGERQGGERPQFAAYNRGKKSVTLDLRNDLARRTYLALVKRADVVVENFRPGTAERMGIGDATLREANPRLVHCAMTGVGSSGPASHRPIYDAIGQALSGLWSVLTDLADPEPIGPPMPDQPTGPYPATGILAPPPARGRPGKGTRTEGSIRSA